MSTTDEETRRNTKLRMEQHGKDAAEKARDIVSTMQAAGNAESVDE